MAFTNRSLDEVLRYKEHHLQTGSFKDCTHLKIADPSDSYFSHRDGFEIYCSMRSFRGPQSRYSEEFCPADCKCFMDRAIADELEAMKEAVAARSRFWRSVGAVVRWPFEWFGKLNGVVQGLLVVALLLKFFPEAARYVLALYNATK